MPKRPHSRGERRVLAQLGEYASPYLAAEQARYQWRQPRHASARCFLASRKQVSRFIAVHGLWLCKYAKPRINQSAEAADARKRMAEAFMGLGMTDPQSQRAAEGRPISGVDADDPIFNMFMILDNYHPRLAHLLMHWAQRHNLTHQREFEEEPRPSEPQTIESDDGKIDPTIY